MLKKIFVVLLKVLSMFSILGAGLVVFNGDYKEAMYLVFLSFYLLYFSTTLTKK